MVTEDNAVTFSDEYRFFSGQGFLPIGAETYPLLRYYERSGSLEGRSAVFLSTWAWAEYGLYALIEQFLCGVYFPRSKPVYFIIHPPANQSSAAPDAFLRLIDVLRDLSCRAGLPALRIKCVEEQMLPQFQALREYTAHIHYSDDESEYIFRPADILAMDGSVNAEKRRSLRKCAGLTGISLVPATNENAPRMMDIEESWCRGRDCAVCASFCGCERKALAIMLNIFDERIHQGLLLYRNDEPSGYAAGDRQNNYAQLYYGKALLPDFFVYLIHAMTEQCFSDAVSFNMGEDMGNPGLRFFKHRLGNHTQWRRYTCDLSLGR